MKRPANAKVVVIGLLASAFFLYLALHNVHGASWRKTWSESHPLPFVVYAGAAYIAGQWVRGMRLRMLVPDATLGLGTATSIVVVGYAANNVLPARLGELVRAGALAERTGMGVTQALTVTVVERILDGLAILALLACGGLVLGPQPFWIRNLERGGVALFSVALLVLLFAVRRPSAILRGASTIAGRLPPWWRDRIIHATSSVVLGAVAVRSPRRLLALAATSLVVWTLETTMFFCLLPAVGLAPNAGIAAVAMGVTNLGILVPSSPGYVGPFHYFCAQALIAQGVSDSTALTYATIVHLTFYVPVTLWGVGAMSVFGMRIGSIFALAGDARRARQKTSLGGLVAHVVASMEPRPSRPPPTRFDRALTEAVVGVAGAPSDALDEAATFLAGQMALLPWTLHALYVAGMFTFRLFVRVRYGRSFCALDAEQRRVVVERWAFGRFELFRQLFRPIRSTVLLAFYESPSAHGA